MDNQTIGLIGTGIMGEPIARNLLRAGFKVCVHSRTKAKAEGLLSNGAAWRSTPAALADGIDTVISVVSDSPDVEAVYLGPDGVVETLRAGSLCIDMSTIAPETARSVASGIGAKGGVFLDAPVSGGKTGADAGTLAIMVGGSDRDLARARPIFNVIGGSVVHCGPVGNGQLTKLCNQLLCGLNLLGVCEAVVLAKRVGLDPHIMLEAVSKGAAGSWALDNLGPRMLDGDFAPMFMIDLQQKDLRIALAAAHDNQVPLPGTCLVSQLLTANQAAGEGRCGTQALVKVLERLGSPRGD